MTWLTYWMRIADNPSFNDKYSSAVLPMCNDEIVHYAVKLESDIFVSFIMPDGQRYKILFGIADVIGQDIFLAYEFDDKQVANVYVNAKEVEFMRLTA